MKLIRSIGVFVALGCVAIVAAILVALPGGEDESSMWSIFGVIVLLVGIAVSGFIAGAYYRGSITLPLVGEVYRRDLQ